MGAGLLNHNPDKIIGPITEPRIERKRGRARLNFDDDEIGRMAAAKVESGSLRGVSVGYSVQSFKELEEGETWRGITGPAMIATRWTPGEISLTPIPADLSVGIGRDLTRSLDGIQIERTKPKKEESNMTPEEIKELQEKLEASEARNVELEAEGKRKDTELADLKKSPEPDPKPRILIEPDDYNELLSRADAISPEARSQFAGWVAEGRGKDEITKLLFDLAITKPDATDTAGPDGIVPKKKSTPNTRNTLTGENIDDDKLFDGLQNPTTRH